jgi:hypothetical protein
MLESHANALCPGRLRARCKQVSVPAEPSYFDLLTPDF